MSFVDTSIDKATGPKISDMLAGMFTDTPEEKQAKAKLDTATATAEEGIKTGREQGNQQYGAILAEKPQTPPALEDAPEKPPAYQSDSPLKNFGGLATIIGVFGGMLTRQPLVASLKAASSAMSAYHSRNLEDYQQAVEEWKTNADYTSKLVDWRLKAYEAASKQSGDNVAAHQAAIQAIAANTQDDVTLQTLAQKGYAATIDHIDKQRDALLKWDENKARLAETAQQHEETMRNHKEMEDIARGKSSASGDTEKDVASIADAEIAKQEKLKGTPLTDAEKAQIRIDARTKAKEGVIISDDAADLAADRVLAGDERATTGMARSTGNITKVTNSIVKLAKERNMDGAAIAAKVAEFAGAMAGERTLATRTTNMEIAANEVKNMAPLALSASATVDRTQYPSLNKIIISAQKGTGDENVVRFGLAANSLIYTYSKFLNPTGIPTDADKARATEILETAWSKGQFAAAIDQIRKEIESGQAALASTKSEISGNLTGKGGVPTGGPTAGPPPMRLNGRQIEVRGGKWVYSDTGDAAE